MKPVKKVNLHKRDRFISVALQLIFAVTGIFLPIFLLIDDKIGIPSSMVIIAVLAISGVFFAHVFHPYYHSLVMRLITISKYGTSKHEDKIIIPLFFSRWEAIFIKVAPFTDLTILGIIGLMFLPGFLFPMFLTFVSTNLLHSASDLLHALYIFKYTQPAQSVRWISEGFEVWE